MTENKYEFNSRQHIHTLGGRPLVGTSTAMGILNKPGLTWWASGMAMEKFGWCHTKNGKETVQMTAEQAFERIKGLSLDEYIVLLSEAYKAHSVKLTDSAQAGTDMHAELEKYVRACGAERDGVPFTSLSEHRAVNEFAEWSVENVAKFIWSEMHVYSEELWVGGITDCGALLKDGKKVMIDFKSSKEAYLGHFLQMALYDLQISENGGFSSAGERLLEPTTCDAYVCIPFGAGVVVPVQMDDVRDLREGAKSALALYKLQQKYDAARKAE